MSKIKRLLQAYSNHIATPWRDDTAAAQRVIFCVYHEGDELKLRAKIDEFEIATHQAKHKWITFDLTDTFAVWLAAQRYAKSYFQKPNLLHPLMPKYLDDLVIRFEESLADNNVDSEAVVALTGVGSLFGILKVKDVVDRLAPKVPGRLVVFFPGTYENNNYKLLDGYDGWNYLAIPLTAGKDF